MTNKTNSKVVRKPRVLKKKFPKMSTFANGLGPAYAMALMRPFSSTGAHIPDDLVTPSCLMTSKYHFRGTFQAISGTSGSIKSGGVLVHPYPVATLLQEVVSGDNILTDVNAAGTASYGSIAIPNLSALGNGLIRCVGIGVTIMYEGTELNRAGRFIAGLIPIAYQASAIASTGTVASQLSTVTNYPQATVTSLRNLMTKSSESRSSGDGAFEAHWEPSGVPHYQALVSSQWATSGSGVTPVDSVYSIQGGANGAERGENALVVLIEGDNTSSASDATNVYSINIVWHWEVVPSDPTAITTEVTPSTADSTALDAVLNMTQRVPVACYKAAVDESSFPGAVRSAAQSRTLNTLSQNKW